MAPLPDRSIHRRRTVLALGMACILTVSACGSDSDESGDERSPETAPAADGSPEEAGDEASGSEESGGESSESESSESESNESESETETDAETEIETETGSSSASATLTLDDGTVYELTTMNSCDTSATAPDSFPLTNGYDLTGRTADGAILLTATRAGFDDDSSLFSGALEGGFDDDGKNATMLYVLQGDGNDLTIDGATISGTITADALAPTRPHGDTTSITVEASC